MARDKDITNKLDKVDEKLTDTLVCVKQLEQHVEDHHKKYHEWNAEVKELVKRHDLMIYGNTGAAGLKTDMELLKDGERKKRKLGFFFLGTAIAFLADYFTWIRFK